MTCTSCNSSRRAIEIDFFSTLKETELNVKNQYTGERIADRMAIQDALYKWCRAIDRLDYEGMRAAFHPDGTDSHGAYNGGGDGLVEWVRERHKPIPFSSHQVSNIDRKSTRLNSSHRCISY